MITWDGSGKMMVPQSPSAMEPFSPQYSLYSPAPAPLNFLNVPVNDWTEQQVSSWLAKILRDMDLAYRQVQFTCDKLRHLDGKALLTLTEADLHTRTQNPNTASIIMVELSNLMTDQGVRGAGSSTSWSISSHSESSSCYAEFVDSLLAFELSEQNNAPSAPSAQSEYHEMKPFGHQALQSHDAIGQEVPRPISRDSSQDESSFGLVPNFPYSPHESTRDRLNSSGEDSNLSSELPSISLLSPDVESEAELAAPSRTPCKRRGGRRKGVAKKAPVRRRTSSSSSLDEEPLKGRLWQFVARLLHDPCHNPSIIRWENEREGVFSFVDGQKVAKLWGAHKGNEDMNYEKMSRAIRYYKSKAFVSDKRRLHFGFGEKAQWREYAASHLSVRAL